MAFGAGTINSFGGAASDLLGAQATADGQRITAAGMEIQADAMEIGADSTRLNAKGFTLKAAGDRAEGQGYGLAADLATQNEMFAQQSTYLTGLAQDRQTLKIGGTQRAQIGGAGFTMGGSSLDILRDSASQAATTKAVGEQQGLITQQGYQEQADSYSIMRSAAFAAATANDEMSTDTYGIADRQDKQAVAQRAVAQQERDLADQTETNGYITGGFKAAAGIASLFI